MNEELKVIENRSKVAMSMATERPDNCGFERCNLIFYIYDCDTNETKRTFVSAPPQNVARALKKFFITREPILALNNDNEPIFEVHSGFIGLNVKEKEIEDYVREIREEIEVLNNEVNF